jgi:hypothetical protein
VIPLERWWDAPLGGPEFARWLAERSAPRSPRDRLSIRI